MIESFRHKGLQRLFEEGSTRGVNPQHVDKIEDILGLLSVAVDIRDMDRPSFRLHPLRGDLKGYWAVTPIDGSFSGSKTGMRSMSILSITIEQVNQCE